MLEAFSETFLQHALLAALLITGICAYLGVFIIFKRVTFVGIALAELSAVGIAVGYYLGENPHLCSFLVTTLGIIYFAFFQSESSLSKESIIGFVYAFASAITILLLSQNPAAEASGLDLISGNLLFVSMKDLNLLLEVIVVIVAIHCLLFKEFIFVTFDRETAATLGLKTRVYEFLLYLSLGLAISVSMKIAGVIFVFAVLVIPAMIGLSLAGKTSNIFIFSIIFGMFSCFGGIYISYIYDLPTGPTIVTVLGVLFLFTRTIKLFMFRQN